MCPVAAKIAAGRGRAIEQGAGTTTGTCRALRRASGDKRRMTCTPNGNSSHAIIASITDAKMNVAACTGRAPR